MKKHEITTRSRSLMTRSQHVTKLLFATVFLWAGTSRADFREWELRGGVGAHGIFLTWPSSSRSANAGALIPVMGMTAHVTYGIRNTWHVGFALNGGWTQNQVIVNADLGDGRTTDVTFGVWQVGGEGLVRYRFDVGRIAPFLEVRAGYRYTTFYGAYVRSGTASTATPTSPSSHGFILTFSPGVEFRATDKLAVDLALGFRWDSGGIATWTIFLDGLIGFVF